MVGVGSGGKGSQGGRRDAIDAFRFALRILHFEGDGYAKAATPPSCPSRGSDLHFPALYAYCMHMEIEWDSDKADSNLEKHGVRFEEAATALLDPMALAQEDAASEGEPRWVLIGVSSQLRLLTVVYTLRSQDRIRLISARKATRKEAKHYA